VLDFDPTEKQANILAFVRQFAKGSLRPASIHADAHEHEKPWDVIRQVHQLQKSGMGFLKRHSAKHDEESGGGEKGQKGVMGVMLAEEMAYGAASVLLSFPGPGLGGAAILASGTDEQKARFLGRYDDDEVRFGAMALTEPGAGSDVSAIDTTAVKQGGQWVLNGTKIFCTNGASADVVVVWATVDRSKGKDGIRAFVVEKGTPGFRVGRLEHKLGIRASETAELVLEDCRIPAENLLGEENPSAEKKGFKGAMATFDMTRPGVAAMAVGIARAAWEHVVDELRKEGFVAPGYGRARAHLSAVEDALIDMEAQIEAARLLTHRAAYLLDKKIPNALEASMAKAKAGRVVVDVCAKAVELLGPEALTRTHPVEMWLRDSKVFDIFEGTGQVQRLVVARKILGYTSKELA
jgi:acyl-CoA dehydrogenase